MNKRIKELMTEAGMKYKLDSSTPHFGEDGSIYLEEMNVYDTFDPEKFAELLVQDIVSKMEVDGSEFYYNEPNDYGCVTVKFFMGPGHPWHTMRGEEVQADYANGRRGTGRYLLNKNFATYLLNSIK